MSNLPTGPTADALDDHAARFLLLGPLALRGREAAEKIATTYKAGPSRWAALWREHELELRTYAATHRLTPIGGRLFFAEGINAWERRRWERRRS